MKIFQKSGVDCFKGWDMKIIPRVIFGIFRHQGVCSTRLHWRDTCVNKLTVTVVFLKQT